MPPSPDAPPLGIQAQRILVYGVTGSGKSTLCRELGEAMDLPWHWVDDLIWEPGWVQSPVDVQRERIAGICAGQQWILDSAYATWIDIPLESVQLIVCLDYPRWASFTRLLRRTFRRAMNQSVVCNGNIETLRRTLSRDSILIWHFKSFRRKRERMRAWAGLEEKRSSNMNPECGKTAPFQVLVFRSPRQTRKWLAEIAG